MSMATMITESLSRPINSRLLAFLPSLVSCLSKVEHFCFFSSKRCLSSETVTSLPESGLSNYAGPAGNNELKKRTLNNIHVNFKTNQFLGLDGQKDHHHQSESQRKGKRISSTEEKAASVVVLLKRDRLLSRNLGQESKSDVWMKSVLQDFHGQVNEYDVVDIFRNLEGEPSLAIAVFHWARSQPAFKTDKFVICALMKVLGRSKDLTSIEYMLNEFMTYTGVPPNTVAFNEVLKAYADTNQLDKMMAAYDHMLTRKLLPNSVTISIVLRSLVKARREYEALGFFQKAKQLGVEFNSHLYGDLIDLYGKLKQPQNVESVLQEMISTGQVPNVFVFSKITQAYCTAKLGEKALLLLEQMRRLRVYPNCVMYLTLIHYFAKQNDKKRVKYLLSKAYEDEVTMDLVFYNGCVNILVKHGELCEAKNLLAIMKSNGVVPDSGTYLTLVSAYVASRKFCEAKSMLAVMKKDLGNIDTLTYTSLMNLYIGCTSKNDSDRVMKFMEACDHWLHRVLLQLLSQQELGGGYFTNEELSNLRADDIRVADKAIAAIVAFLVNNEKSRKARNFWSESRAQGFLRGFQYQTGNMWILDFHGLHPLAVEPVLKAEFLKLKTFCDGNECPPSVHIITGWGRSRDGKLNPTVKDSIKTRVSAIFESLKAPFHQSRKNGGRQSAQGRDFRTWLQNQRTKNWLLL